MKKVLYFIRWQYQRMDSWQKWWIVACFFFGATISAEDGSTHKIVTGTICAVIFTWLFVKAFIIDAIRSSWQNYNEEQQKITDILKQENFDGKR